MIAEVRERSDHEIPLAWDHHDHPVPAAIEVYPAATLRAHCIPSPFLTPDGLCGPEVLRLLTDHLDVQSIEQLDQLRRDGLAAVICVLAAVEFLEGSAMPPVDVDLAAREGWIWVRRPPPHPS